MAHYFTTTLAVVAGLCLAFGMLFLFVGLRRTRRGHVDLLFAGFAFAYGAAVLTARSHYVAATAAEARMWDRATVILASVAFILLIWFVAAYTGTARGRARWVLIPLTWVFLAIAAIGLVAPDLVLGDVGTVEVVVLPWGEQVLVASGENAIVDPVSVLAQLGAIGLIIAMAIRQFRTGDRERAVFLSVGLGWFISTLVVSLLVDADVVDFVYLSDIGFVGFVVALSLELAKSMLDTEEELLAYQRHLQTMVDEQTSALQSAQAELVLRAAEDAAQAERGRLARDLHDAVTQLLFSINLVAQSLPRLWDSDPAQAKRSSTELSRLARGALAEMRTLLRELRPQALTETDLPTLVGQLCEGLEARQGLDAEVQVQVRGALPPEVHTAVYRVAQEAINNIAKHAGASSLSVTITGDADHLSMRVVDNGQGFEPPDEPSGTMGLDIMHERAASIGADLSVTSDPQGTTVTMTWAASQAVVT